MKVQHVAAAVAAVAMLAGCGGGAPKPPATSSTASSKPTESASVGDVAACKAYLRISPGASNAVSEVQKSGTPMFLIIDAFKEMADQLQAGSVAATTPALVTSLKSTTNGARSAEATANAWTEGQTLDLNPDLQVLADASLQVVQFCQKADPSGNYMMIAGAS